MKKLDYNNMMDLYLICVAFKCTNLMNP